MTGEATNRPILADAIATWALDHAYTADDLRSIDGSGRMACARLARRASPVLNERFGYIPSDETWDLAMRLLEIRSTTGDRTAGAPEPEDEPDPFRGFPREPV